MEETLREIQTHLFIYLFIYLFIRLRSALIREITQRVMLILRRHPIGPDRMSRNVGKELPLRAT